MIKRLSFHKVQIAGSSVDLHRIQFISPPEKGGDCYMVTMVSGVVIRPLNSQEPWQELDRIHTEYLDKHRGVPE